MRLKCQKCGYLWDYTGSKDRATCPDCKTKVPVESVSLQDLDEMHEYLYQRQSTLLQRVPRDLSDQLDEIEATMVGLQNETRDRDERLDALESEVAEIKRLLEMIVQQSGRRND